jgi:hypothetical protein
MASETKKPVVKETIDEDEVNKRIMMIFKTQGEAAGLKALMTRYEKSRS